MGENTGQVGRPLPLEADAPCSLARDEDAEWEGLARATGMPADELEEALSAPSRSRKRRCDGCNGLVESHYYPERKIVPLHSSAEHERVSCAICGCGPFGGEVQ